MEGWHIAHRFTAILSIDTASSCDSACLSGIITKELRGIQFLSQRGLLAEK